MSSKFVSDYLHEKIIFSGCGLLLLLLLLLLLCLVLILCITEYDFKKSQSFIKKITKENMYLEKWKKLLNFLNHSL